MAINVKEFAAALGHNAVAWITMPSQDPGEKYPMNLKNTFRLATSSTMDEPGGYCHAESVTLEGKQIEKLRDFLNEHYPPMPKNPDIVAMFKEVPRMSLAFMLKDDIRVDTNEALYDINSFGKVFYDRGYDVNSEYSNVTGMRKVTVTHKPKTTLTTTGGIR